MKVLLTGGAGYIGSHTAVELIAAGHEVVIVDSLINSKISVIDRINEVSGAAVTFIQQDVSDTAALSAIIEMHAVTAVIHFAGLKAVGESVTDPLRYYHHNLTTSLSLFQAMQQHHVKTLVFSSSATVYGDPERIPIDEHCNADLAANPYGQTKVLIEKILGDICVADPSMNVARLRYFNPAGAHPSARMGEAPSGVPNNLVPFLTQVAIGSRPELVVYGNDYPTSDGTCIRDYIHVQDLARGHVAALNKLVRNSGLVTYNIGTGQGYSVLEMIHAFEKATGQALPHRMGPRRAGDIPVSYTDPALAERELGWKAVYGIDDICRDAWRWQQQNPEGYP